MTKLLRLLAPVLTLACLSLLPSPARADLMFFTSFGAFQSTPGSDVDNVLFNEAGLTNVGTTIEGATQGRRTLISAYF